MSKSATRYRRRPVPRATVRAQLTAREFSGPVVNYAAQVSR